MVVKKCHPFIFIVKINKEKQKEHAENYGNGLYLSTVFSFGTRGLQRGEIYFMGEAAKDIMPFAKVGGELLFTWKVEYDNADENKNLLFEDKENKYYSVSCINIKGRENECYGYIDESGEVLTHPEFLLLEKTIDKSMLLSVNNEGVVYSENYELDEFEIEEKSKNNFNQIYALTDSGINQNSKEKIRELEKENANIALVADEYRPYKIAFSNPYNKEMPKGKNIFAWTIACMEEIRINDNDFIIAKAKHIGMAI